MRKLCILVVSPVLSITSAFGAIITTSVFALGTSPGVMATGPDSVTAGNGSVWVAYSNGADSTGLPGPNSLVVQYNSNGTVQHTYSLPGYVDGLKINPANGNVWALQNQDGNSTLTIINTTTNTAGPAIPYSVTSGTRGYDDVVFSGGSTYLSYTNPTLGTDPIIQQLINGSNPLAFSSNILTMGASGTNLATGLTGPIIATDPDSMKLTLTGSLMLTSGSDGTLTFVSVPGGSVSFLQLLNPSTGGAVSGLDDAIFPTTTNGTFYVADTGNNRVLAIHATGLTLGSLFADVGSLNEFGSVNTGTGVVSPTVTSVSGVNLSAPHGIDFVADAPEPATGALVGLALIGAILARRRISV
jgi:PEP-CTERM motif